MRACTLDTCGCVGNALGRISRTHSPDLKGIGGNIDVIRGEKGSWDSISATKVVSYSSPSEMLEIDGGLQRLIVNEVLVSSLDK